jgi:hypothetical protein
MSNQITTLKACVKQLIKENCELKQMLKYEHDTIAAQSYTIDAQFKMLDAQSHLIQTYSNITTHRTPMRTQTKSINFVANVTKTKQRRAIL